MLSTVTVIIREADGRSTDWLREQSRTVLCYLLSGKRKSRHGTSVHTKSKSCTNVYATIMDEKRESQLRKYLLYLRRWMYLFFSGNIVRSYISLGNVFRWLYLITCFESRISSTRRYHIRWLIGYSSFSSAEHATITILQCFDTPVPSTRVQSIYDETTFEKLELPDRKNSQMHRSLLLLKQSKTKVRLLHCIQTIQPNQIEMFLCPYNSEPNYFHRMLTLEILPAWVIFIGRAYMSQLAWVN